MSTRGGNSHSRANSHKSKSKGGSSHRKSKGARAESQKTGGTTEENKAAAQLRVDINARPYRSPTSILNTPFKLCDSCVQSQLELAAPARLADFSEDMVPTPTAVDPAMMEECMDRDRPMNSAFFDKRNDFLTLCQGNHYQCVALRCSLFLFSLLRSFHCAYGACTHYKRPRLFRPLLPSFLPASPPSRLPQIRPAASREAFVNDGDLAHAPPEGSGVRALVQ